MTIHVSGCRFKVGDLVRMKDRRCRPHGVCVVKNAICEGDRRAYKVTAPDGDEWLCREDMLELVSSPSWDKESI